MHRLYLVLVFLFLVACQTAVPSTPTPTSAPPSPTAVSSHTPIPTPSPTATAAPPPLPTQPPPPTPTAVPTFTATPTPSATPTTAVDRTCPQPPPAKPDYPAGVLGTQPWPTPDTAVAQPHFWFTDPVQGGRQPLENQYYPYGWDGGARFLLHNGSDFPQELGTPVTAVADGTVVVAQSDTTVLYGWRCDWYGQLVVLELDQTWQGQPVYVLYGHVQNIQVQTVQPVRQGDVLAEIGVEGVSLVPHLHLEVRLGRNEFDATVNPMLWLPPLSETGLLAGRVVDGEGRPWQGVRVTLIDASTEEARFFSTFTYLGDRQQLIHADVGWGENFVFADMEPGNYTLHVRVEGVDYRTPLTIVAGEVTTAEIITAPAQTPSPSP